MSGLLTKLFIFVVLMVFGYGFARKNAVSREFSRHLSSLVINFFMTASIINPVLNFELQLDGRALANILLIVCLVMLLSNVLGTLATHFMKLPTEREPLFLLLIAVMNNVFVGMPVVEELYGPQAAFYCALSCIPFNVLLYTYGVYRLKGGRSGGIRLQDIVTMPLIATMTALLIFLLKIPVPPILRELCASVAAATMPLSMVVIGVSLSSVSLADAFKNKCLYGSSFLRLIAGPVLTWLLCRLLTDDPLLLKTAVIIAACPAGVVTSVLAIQYEKDAVFSSQGILQSTVLSMLTIPVFAFLLEVI